MIMPGSPRSPYLVIDEFLPRDMALAMRADIDAHFAEPGQHRAESHQVWNYWFVPELYAYLRTAPEKVIRRELVQMFADALKGWSIERLGMAQVTWPYLSLYVPGCRQGLHNDTINGRFGFVYSLTLDERKTSGGETIILHEGDPFRSKLTTPAAGRGLYDAVAPRFNRLIVFDDRLPHAVERIEGVMDPREGRFVLHGHLGESGWIVAGPLPPQTLLAVVTAALETGTASLREQDGAAGAAPLAAHHGPFTLRIQIAPEGHVAFSQLVMDRVVSPLGDESRWLTAREEIMAAIAGCVFPAAPAPTIAIMPMLFGGAPPAGAR